MQHGIICRKPESFFGYFGWGSVARLDERTLVAACSGERSAHVCPFNKTELFYSFDEGLTWSPPVVVNDTALDDRDAGIVHLGGDRLLVTWFSHPLDYFVEYLDPAWENTAFYKNYVELAKPHDRSQYGSFLRLSDDRGLTWGPIQKIDVSSPHGPSVMLDGSLLYLGKEFHPARSFGKDRDKRFLGERICALRSADGGLTWTEVGEISLPEAVEWDNFHEPHAIQLPSGRILGMIRFETRGRETPYKGFTMFQTHSDDSGMTWSKPIYTGVSGSPPHLLRHSSGAIVCVYGRREEPFGERAMVSYDDGATWTRDFELYPGVDGDLGYPASVELSDGSILTVYYHKYPGDKLDSFLYTRWEL